jgi:hypothetical protein
MASSNLTTNLSVGILTPAPSVRPADGNTSNRDTQDNPRRSPTQAEKERSKDKDKGTIKDQGEDAEESRRDEPDPGGTAEHQLDQLA